jgi:acetolactate synthase small subunit
MRSLYASNALTRQGQNTRSKILSILAEHNGLTRNEIVAQSDLTYEQVRNQTQNLIEEQKIRSEIESGHRRYYLTIVAILVLFMPLLLPMVDSVSIGGSQSELIDC